jgi:hypothetical protein
MHYNCFLVCPFVLSALNPMAILLFHIRLVGSRPEKMAFMSTIYVFNTISNTCNNKLTQNHMYTGPMNTTILLGFPELLEFFNSMHTVQTDIPKPFFFILILRSQLWK